MFCLVAPAVTADADGAEPVALALSGSTGAGRLADPHPGCGAGSFGPFRHYDYETTAAPGEFTLLGADARFHMDVHEAPAGGFLPGEDSFLLLANARGTAKLALRSGDCQTPTLLVDGDTVLGEGAWRVGGSSGAYRQIAGSGAFGVDAEAGPGADNAWSLRLSGNFDALDPSLAVAVRDVSWERPGFDYAARRLAVRFGITNSGPGDAFGARLLTWGTTTAGVTPLDASRTRLPDLRAGESTTVRVRYRLAAASPPCDAAVASCRFRATLDVRLPDALDVPATHHAEVEVRAPDLPSGGI